MSIPVPGLNLASCLTRVIHLKWKFYRPVDPVDHHKTQMYIWSLFRLHGGGSGGPGPMITDPVDLTFAGDFPWVIYDGPRFGSGSWKTTELYIKRTGYQLSSYDRAVVVNHPNRVVFPEHLGLHDKSCRDMIGLILES